jgi:hypothetical protein
VAVGRFASPSPVYLCRDRLVEPLRNIPKLKILRGEARPDLRTLFWQPVELGFQLGTLGELPLLAGSCLNLAQSNTNALTSLPHARKTEGR